MKKGIKTLQNMKWLKAGLLCLLVVVSLWIVSFSEDDGMGKVTGMAGTTNVEYVEAGFGGDFEFGEKMPIGDGFTAELSEPGEDGTSSIIIRDDKRNFLWRGSGFIGLAEDYVYDFNSQDGEVYYIFGEDKKYPIAAKTKNGLEFFLSPDMVTGDVIENHPYKIIKPDGSFIEFTYPETTNGLFKLTENSDEETNGAKEIREFYPDYKPKSIKVLGADGSYQTVEIIYTNNGDVKSYKITAGDKVCESKKDECICGDDKRCGSGIDKILKEGETAVFWSRFSDAMSGMSQGIEGGKAISTLFNWEYALEWRESVEKFFANNVLGMVISGRWEESLCHSYISSDKGKSYVNIDAGLVQTGVHIEGERSSKITAPDIEDIDNDGNTEEMIEMSFYKITYSVQNGLNSNDINAVDGLKFNLYLYNGDVEMAALFNSDVDLEKGDSKSETGSNARVKYSTNYYDKVCIEFSSGTPDNWQLTSRKLCNKIIEYQGEPTEYAEQETDAAEEGGTEEDVLVENDNW